MLLVLDERRQQQDGNDCAGRDDGELRPGFVRGARGTRVTRQERPIVAVDHSFDLNSRVRIGGADVAFRCPGNLVILGKI